jgi:hypothetical protein
LLSEEKAIELAVEGKSYHDSEREKLDIIRRYWKGRQALPAVIPTASPREVHVMGRIARVNVCGIVIDSLGQSMFVDGYRGKDEEQNAEVWQAWQRNRLDSRQTGIHRATSAYGAAYAVVLPGDQGAVMRGASPRSLTAMYGEDPDWPMWALQKMDNRGSWRLLDEEGIYYLSTNGKGEFSFIASEEHGAGVTPVVRFLDEEDLDIDDDVEPIQHQPDVPMRGQVAPLMSVQDQIDLTTLGLVIAQHYSAFRQRYAIGWVAPTEKELLDQMLAGPDGEVDEDASATADQIVAARRVAQMNAAASTLWTFDENPEDLKLGEFEQTNLDGYIRSRESSIRHAAALSQTPAHELIGDLVNLSAEALAAAEAGRDRKVDERQTLLGEAHEQALWLAGRFEGKSLPDDAQVTWRDTSARAFSATVDALGKLTQMLGIPPQELWERVPGATRQDVQRWKAAAADGDSFRVLADLLERQAGDGAEPALT